MCRFNSSDTEALKIEYSKAKRDERVEGKGGAQSQTRRSWKKEERRRRRRKEEEEEEEEEEKKKKKTNVGSRKISV